jgi:hypothetical protein
MPKLATYKRIITSDFDNDSQPLVEQIAFPINDGFNALYFAVDGRLSLKDNIYCTVKDIEITVNAAGNPTSTTSFTLDRTNVQVLGCQVLAASNQTNSAVYPTGQPFISFTQNSSSVIINNITGLQANQRYKIRVVAYLD